MRSGDRLLAGGVIVSADNRTGGGRRIGDFYCLFSRSVYGEILTLEFSHSVDLVSVKKRCIPNIITQVLHLNLNPTLKRSGYYNFLVCHMGLHFSSIVEGDQRWVSFS
jgi:hypothetical protein